MKDPLAERALQTSISVISVFLLWYLGVFYFEGGSVDDSFILYRYAENLSEGYGLVWNKGGETVQGFTSMLWVAILALTETFTKSKIHEYAPQIGLLCSTATLVLTHISTYKILEDNFKILSVAVPISLSLSPVFVRHSISGMETALAMLSVSVVILVSVFYSCSVSYGILASLVTIISGLVRPDLLIISGTLFSIVYFSESESYREFAELVSVYYLSCTIIGLSYVAWKIWYFGDIVPLSAYIKTNSERVLSSAKFILSWQLRYFAYVAVPITVSLFALINFSEKTSQFKGILYSTLGFLLYLLFVVPIMNFHFRYQMVTFISIFIASVVGLQVLLNNFKLLSIEIVSISIILMLILAMHNVGRFTEVRNEAMSLHQNKEKRVMFAKLIKNTDKIKVADTEAGRLPYYSKVRHIDLLGLNNKFIAYNRYDNDFEKKFNKYIQDEKPDIYMYKYPNPRYLVIEDDKVSKMYETVCNLKFRAAILKTSNKYEEIKRAFKALNESSSFGGDCAI